MVDFEDTGYFGVCFSSEFVEKMLLSMGMGYRYWFTHQDDRFYPSIYLHLVLEILKC